MKRFAYYPGCSLEKMSSEYDASFRNLCELLGIELDEPDDWFCCGAGMLGSLSPMLALAVPLKNLAIVRREGAGELVSPCSACYSQFKRSLHEVERDPKLREELEGIVEEPLDSSVGVLHPLEMLEREMNGRTPPAKQPLPQLNVACYYGCLLTRPPKIVSFDDCEDPQSMERLLGRVGIATVDWSRKTYCCGAFYAMVNPTKVLELTRTILEAAAESGANAIAVACPVCHLNLDARQPEVNAKFGTSFDLPVFYFSQLLGWVLGVPAEGLGLWRHVIDPGPLLEGKVPLRPVSRPAPAVGAASRGATETNEVPECCPKPAV
jgi:heterodisulfide reductase subunit B